jgi:hypothetical protein
MFTDGGGGRSSINELCLRGTTRRKHRTLTPRENVQRMRYCIALRPTSGMYVFGTQNQDLVRKELT